MFQRQAIIQLLTNTAKLDKLQWNLDQNQYDPFTEIIWNCLQNAGHFSGFNVLTPVH